MDVIAGILVVALMAYLGQAIWTWRRLAQVRSVGPPEPRPKVRARPGAHTTTVTSDPETVVPLGPP